MIEDEDEVLAQSAHRLAKWGNFEEAEVIFRRAIQLNPIMRRLAIVSH